MKNTSHQQSGRYRLLKGLAFGMGAVAGVHVASALTLDRIVQYVELIYTSGKIDLALDGYTIAFLSDIHTMPAGKLKQVANRINARQVDLLLLGGDFPQGSGLWRALRILSGAKPADGIFGVAGNHDYPPDYFHAMRANGIHPLSNEGLSIRKSLYLSGVEDLRRGHPDVAKATAGAGADEFILLLTHNPDTLLLQDGNRVAVALCGHTHGGQITFLGLWAPAMTCSRHISRYGQKLRSGWVRTDGGTDFYVNNGLGSHFGVPRVFARPQVVFLTLRRGK
jgi:predicted MPP superfamily phosphohydrolase